jgi:hypothetical protein
MKGRPMPTVSGRRMIRKKLIINQTDHGTFHSLASLIVDRQERR